MPHAKEEFHATCWEKATTRYGERLPRTVAARLEDELEKIGRYGQESLYLLVIRIAEYMHAQDILFHVGWYAGGALVLYLCGVTEVNPLPPHYRCTVCGQWEDSAETECRFGLDLKQKTCSRCGGALWGDGYDIPFDFLCGFDGSRIPSFSIAFDGAYKKQIQSMLEKSFPYCVFSVTEDAVPWQHGALYDIIENTHRTETKMQSEPAEASLFEMLKVPKNKHRSFSEMMENIGHQNGEGVSGMLIFREDIMTDLAQCGMDSFRAYQIAEILRKGRRDTFSENVLSALSDCGITEETIKVMKNIRYLFPKTHAAEWAICALRQSCIEIHTAKKKKRARREIHED